MELAEAADRQAPARRQIERGTHLLDDRRSLDRPPATEPLAAKDRAGLRLARDKEGAHACRLGPMVRRLMRPEPGWLHRHPADKTKIDDLDRPAGVQPAELALEIGAEPGADRLGIGPLGDRHGDLVGLARIARIDLALAGK